jgi:soluble lytic murein transglycosylase-like protein
MEKSKKWKTILIMCLIGIDLLVTSYIYSEVKATPSDEPERIIERISYVKAPYYTREAVNERISWARQNGEFTEVLNLYEQLTGNRYLSNLIIEKALQNQIPVNLFFAVVQKESSFNPRAQGIYDEIGLMQLHPVVFSRLIEENGKTYLWEPENNLRWGASHLKYRYMQTGSWDLAVSRYNGTGEDALQYLVKVQMYEREYDTVFNSVMR